MLLRSWFAASAVTTSLLAVIACASSAPGPSAPSGPVASSEVVIAAGSASPGASASSAWTPLVAASSTGEAPRSRGPLRVVSEQIELPTPMVFYTAKATLRDESSGLLDALAATILNDPSMTLVRVEGHSDSQGDAQMNLRLTDGRALAVVQALVARGVERDRLLPLGLGETRPIADNDTAPGRALNRRIEVHVAQRARRP